MGNMYEKTERLEALTSCLLKESGVAADEKALVRAARLSKADLVTGMVTEFTELQGTMGREYALLDGEGDTVSTAIGEQYMPRFAGDELPQTNEAVSLPLPINWIISQQPSAAGKLQPVPRIPMPCAARPWDPQYRHRWKHPLCPYKRHQGNLEPPAQNESK